MPRLPPAVALLALALAAPAALATHSDGTYDLPIWYSRGEARIDVLVVPADHGPVWNGEGVLGGDAVGEAQPCTNSYTRAMWQSVLDWRRGILELGADWLVAGLTIEAWLVGCGPAPPASALADPEAIVLADENKLVFLGLATNGQTAPCVVLNSKAFVQSFTYNDMYNINSQEFGHCLGLMHVAHEQPAHDVMNGLYPYTPGRADNPRNCVSNLDVRGVESAFATVLGQAGGGETASVPANQYAQISC